MMTNTKSKPKSCSCRACKPGRGHNPSRRTTQRYENKSLRRTIKAMLKMGVEDIPTIVYGTYTD